MIKLYQFPISHYCEKIRWTLDFKCLEYKAINLLPGLHIKTTKQIARYSSVPVLTDGDVCIQNSSKIISYLDTKYPEHNLTPKEHKVRKDALEWERYVDVELGIHVRVCCYHILLEYPDIVIPFFTHKGPWYGKLVIKLSFNKLKTKMRQLMKINVSTFKHSKAKMGEAIDKIYNHLQHNEFLAGNKFTRADLAAASLLAPLVMPNGYGLNWPKKIPVELLKLQNEFKHKITWVNEIYNKYH